MLWPAPSRPKAMRVGACDCWRARWWSSASSRPPAIQRSSGCSKKPLQPHRRKYWVIPPKASGAFVAAMEDVLSVYTRPRDPDRPVVCLDETSKQLVAETHAPVAMQPGLPARVDYEYARNGVANLFMMFAPLEGWRSQGHRPPHRCRLRPRSERPGRRPLRASRNDRPHPG